MTRKFKEAEEGSSYNVREWDDSIDRVTVEKVDRPKNLVQVRYPDGERQVMRLDVLEQQIMAKV